MYHPQNLHCKTILLVNYKISNNFVIECITHVPCTLVHVTLSVSFINRVFLTKKRVVIRENCLFIVTVIKFSVTLFIVTVIDYVWAATE